jgi:hypothetical protein
MEMMIIAAIAIVAFAAVLIPLFRRPAGGADAGEFEGDAPAPAGKARRPADAKPGRKPGPKPGPKSRPESGPKSGHAGGARPSGSRSVAEADPLRGEGVVPPMAAGPVSPVDASAEGADSTYSSDTAGMSDDELELEVQRYRAAMRAGTVCTKCGQANPADSSFCFDCGAALPLAEAREFE